MKKQLLLYPGDGIGLELFKSLAGFFRKFEILVEFRTIQSLDEFFLQEYPLYLLCGPLSDDLNLSKHIQEYTELSVIPSNVQKSGQMDSVCIVSFPLNNQNTQIYPLKDVDLLNHFFSQDQKIVLVHGYKQAFDKWLPILKSWSKLAFTPTDFRLEDRDVYSFIKHGDYCSCKQIITSSEIEPILSGLYASLNNSLILCHRLFLFQKSAIALPMHGHAPDIVGMGIANPYALMMSFCSLLNEMGYNEVSQYVENQIKRILFEHPEQITPDQDGILNTEKYMAMIAEYINL
jgi:hypothetical protein